MPKQKALIAGATGVVGRNLLKHLLATGGWEITALSRRTPDVQGDYEHLAVDLLDAAQCKAKLGHLADVTHIFYVAVATHPDPLAPALIDSNLTMVVGIYAVISKALGLPLCHPGSPGNYHALYQCTDSGMLARAVVWMATTPQCANQAFNVTNGDLIRWEDTWPRIAQYFGMAVGARRHISLVKTMADKGAVWDRLVRTHDLRPISYPDIVQWRYGDLVFAPEFDVISGLNKLRQFGFHESVDTEKMFFRMWDEMRADRILPPAE